MAKRTEPQALEDGREQRRVLETIAAATGPNELGLEPLQVDAHPPAEEHVDVLERDRRHVRAEEARERFVHRLGPVAPADALEMASRSSASLMGPSQ